MKCKLFLFILFAIFNVSQAQSQLLPRTFGARAYSMDDGTGSGHTMTWDIGGYLDQSYTLHWPSDIPNAPLSYFAIDALGNMSWVSPTTMPALTLGNIWCGNNLNIAVPMAPGQVGSILAIDALSMPEWTTIFPSQISIPASQLSSGTLQPGVNITVGTGASLYPSEGGSITSNQLSGAGTGKYSGVISIPEFAPSIDVLYSGITGASVVIVSISDPNASEFSVIANVTSIIPGIGFTVTFTAPYPNPQGSLHYAVINQ